MSAADVKSGTDDSGLRMRKGVTQTCVEAVKDAPQEEIVKTEVSRPDYEKGMTALQKHSAFFDRNHDNKITLLETWQGFRAIGFNWLTSAVFAWILNAGLAWPTQKSWIPGTTIYLDGIHR